MQLRLQIIRDDGTTAFSYTGDAKERLDRTFNDESLSDLGLVGLLVVPRTGPVKGDTQKAAQKGFNS